MDILFEDAHLLVVNKPPGMPVAPDPTGDTSLFKVAAERLENEKPGSSSALGLPHRLDRPTSGIVIFTKDKRTLAKMGAAFAGNRVRKTYWAAVDAPPQPASGSLVHTVRFDPKKNKAYAYDSDPADGKKREPGKKAVLRYRLIGRSERFFLLEILPETGRHHQIRAQLARAGLHIKGDVKYGYPRTNAVPGIHLHAKNVAFDHPVTRKKVELSAPLPDDPVWNALAESAGHDYGATEG